MWLNNLNNLQAKTASIILEPAILVKALSMLYKKKTVLKIVVVIQHFCDFIRAFAALQLIFSTYLLKWGSDQVNKISIFCKWFHHVYIYYVISTLINILKLDVENIKLFLRFLTLLISTLKYYNVVNVTLKPWNLETLQILTLTNRRCFNVALTLPNVATSYQHNNNVETTLKCLLGSDNKKSDLWWCRNIACGDLTGSNRIRKKRVPVPSGLVWGKRGEGGGVI